MAGTPITKPFDATALYEEAIAAGVSLPRGMSSDGLTIYTHDISGKPADMPAGFAAVYAAHDASAVESARAAAKAKEAVALAALPTSTQYGRSLWLLPDKAALNAEIAGPLKIGPAPLPASTTAVGASATVLINGTSIAIPTGALRVGNRFRFKLNMTKTAAGTAAWQAHVKFGTANTNADATIARWTSGTNTAAIDQCMLHIDAEILTLGAAATARCFAWYNNTLTQATGFGIINPIPTATAAFNSAAANPFLHIDIQSGASAAYTAIGTAEVLA